MVAQEVASGGSSVVPVLLGSLVPVALWMVFFYTRDRYDPEPKGLVLALFLVGAFPVLFVAGTINSIWFAVLGPVLAIVVLGPFTEEALKFVGVTLLTAKHRAFDEPIDGMIYGSTMGLGFAATENMGYLSAAYLGLTPFGTELTGCSGVECLFFVAFLRGLTSTSMHAMASGIAGYFLAQQIPRARPWAAFVPAVLTSAAVHGLFNGVAISTGLAFLTLPIPIVLYVVLMRRSLAASPLRVAQITPTRMGPPGWPPAAPAQRPAAMRPGPAVAGGPAVLEGGGPLAGMVYRLVGRTSVGRSWPGGSAVEMDLGLFPAVAQTVSPLHAELWSADHDRTWHVRSLDPAAPTWLVREGHFTQVAERGLALSDGDALTFGAATFRFRSA